ncbi:PD-(D/E)XK nuclease-like domain-containing protein [Paracandidimonas lactea]|uniref:PD-(D/E)XK nuclease-like domain-containing protein n=1 Tax=Paracandidimonas lactea TaxID=2895524 RepID=UPI001F2D499C|nr:PD-(D/E)XK nuclease-like domain-containing protein [Paracandidimonas lactea]
MNVLTDRLEPLGIIEDQDIEQYHRGAGISKTGLDLIERSPAHYFAEYLDPNRPPKENDETPARLAGHLAHCAILEPAEFDKRYAVLPADAPRKPTSAQWNAKNPSSDSLSAMAWWREWLANNEGRTIITHEQRETALRQAESVRRLPDIRDALDRGRPEVSAYWRDSGTGVLCRCRPDWVHDAGPGRAILVDVKTYSNAAPVEFARQIARMRYHVQAAYYTDGYAAAANVDVLAFVFLAVETEYPYAASAVMLDEASLEQGRAEYRRNVSAYAQCLSSGEWPGYPEGIQPVSLPAWAMTDIDH